MEEKNQPVLSPALRRFLARPRVARLATVGQDGYPHVVPIYFLRDEDDLLFGSDADERKVWNARRNPRGAVVIGGELETGEAGYLIQGDLTVEPDPGRRFLRRMTRRYHPSRAEAEAWAAGEGVVIRLKPRKVIRVC